MKASAVKVGMVVCYIESGSYYRVVKLDKSDVVISIGAFVSTVDLNEIRPLTKRERGEGGAK